MKNKSNGKRRETKRDKISNQRTKIPKRSEREVLAKVINLIKTRTIRVRVNILVVTERKVNKNVIIITYKINLFLISEPFVPTYICYRLNPNQICIEFSFICILLF